MTAGRLEDAVRETGREEKKVAVHGAATGESAAEQKAAVAGALSGSAVTIGIALAIEGAKQWLSRGGTGQ